MTESYNYLQRLTNLYVVTRSQHEGWEEGGRGGVRKATANSPGTNEEGILVLLQQFEVVLMRLVTQKSLRLLLSCKTQEHNIFHRTDCVTAVRYIYVYIGQPWKSEGGKLTTKVTLQDFVTRGDAKVDLKPFLKYEA